MEILYFYRPLRIMLRDWDDAVRMYPDPVLADAVRVAISFNKLPGFALTPDQNSITPEFTTADQFALVNYHTLKLFLQSLPDRFSFRTRGYSESIGSASRFLSTIENEIHQLENGAMFGAYQNYYNWLHGMVGLPLGEFLAQFDVRAPLWKATFTRDGMRVA